MFPMCIYDTKSILWAVGSEMYIGFKFVIPWDGCGTVSTMPLSGQLSIRENLERDEPRDVELFPR